LIQLQRLREEAEKAREEALAAAHKAEREADELRRKQAELDRQAEEAQSLREARLRLVSGDRVRVPRYDKVGKVVRTDFKKNVVVVNLGLGQWEVALDEVFPMAD
jgi:dsDNA-specific endonuclease/ATPase MutS2